MSIHGCNVLVTVSLSSPTVFRSLLKQKHKLRYWKILYSNKANQENMRGQRLTLSVMGL